MVREEFKNVCLENYDLDPAWYYTAPGLAYDAALRESQVKLELLTDVDMLMIERGSRGGISMISKRYGKVNNKYMGEDHDSAKPSKFIQYLDASNLYGWVMCKPPPVGGFKWMTEEELKNWEHIPCIFEVGRAFMILTTIIHWLPRGSRSGKAHS